MNTADVHAIVRDVIVHHGLPFTVLAITESPAGWSIEVRPSSGGVVRLTLPGTRPVAMRVAIQQKLEATL